MNGGEFLKLQHRYESLLRMSSDALQRSKDGLRYSAAGDFDGVYSSLQLARAFAWLSEARELLERNQAASCSAAALELEKQRVADPTYTPSLNEAADNVTKFVDGFRQSEKGGSHGV